MSASQPSHGLILIPEAKNASELANNGSSLCSVYVYSRSLNFAAFPLVVPLFHMYNVTVTTAETLLGLASERARKGLTKEYEKHDTHVVAQILESKPGGLPTLPYEPDSVFVTSEGETYKVLRASLL